MSKEERNVAKSNRIEDVWNYGPFSICRHEATGVHYLIRRGPYAPAMCVMVNTDGTPYTGEQEVE